MVQALQSQGHTVAMTGDGVNDVLALKEADCSIAMAQGSDAAKNIANVVLLDSKFCIYAAYCKSGTKSRKQHPYGGIHVPDQDDVFRYVVIADDLLWKYVSV